MPATDPVNDDSRPLLARVRQLPEKPGVYLMRDRLGRIVYVGKAKNLRKRVSSYFTPSRAQASTPKIRALIEAIVSFDTIEVKSEPEALLLEGKLIKQYKPRYNTDFTDDKRFLLVRVDLAEELPRFRLTRFRKDDHARYFGPFVHSGPLRRTLAGMRRRFGILLSDTSPARCEDGRWMLYDDVRRELYGGGEPVAAAEYRARVEAACAFLEGQSRAWLEELRSEMAQAAAKLDFERAAELRDAIQAMEQTLERTRKFERDHPVVVTDVDAAEALAVALSLPRPPRTLECFDISHISGTFVVASMVRFADGRPDKANYRRFQIRSFVGNDDYRAMEEVVSRRYRRLRDEGRPLPDLIVIDGGRGQLGAAHKAFFALDLPAPPMVGLAKEHETIIFSDERPPLNLPLTHPGLNLIQRLRDEAHRFANTYNADLRSRKIRESILDDFPGLGEVRRTALLGRFGDIDRLRSASVEELREVPGFGPVLARELHDFLHR